MSEAHRHDGTNFSRARLPPASREERDLLQELDSYDAVRSRLSCQLADLTRRGLANINIRKLHSMCRRKAFSALSGRDQHDRGPRANTPQDRCDLLSEPTWGFR